MILQSLVDVCFLEPRDDVTTKVNEHFAFRLFGPISHVLLAVDRPKMAGSTAPPPKKMAF